MNRISNTNSNVVVFVDRDIDDTAQEDPGSNSKDNKPREDSDDGLPQHCME